MLVLSRKLGESVMIGNDVAVKVVEIRGNRVKLGFDCPAGLPVHREELHRRFAVSDLFPDATGEADASPYFSEFT